MDKSNIVQNYSRYSESRRPGGIEIKVTVPPVSDDTDMNHTLMNLHQILKIQIRINAGLPACPQNK